MYFFIYDTILNDRKHLPFIQQVESRLMQLGISGRHEKLTILKNFKEVVEDALKRGAESIIAVGNDETFSKLIGYLPTFNVTIGFIPVASPSFMASLLGIPAGVNACDVISARLTEKLDMGSVGGTYFISHLEIPHHPDLRFNFNQFSVSPTAERSRIRIYNAAMPDDGQTRKVVSSPKDGALELVITPENPPKSRWLDRFRKQPAPRSVFPVQRVTISCASESLSLTADGQHIVKTPATVEVLPRRLKVIVGRKRLV